MFLNEKKTKYMCMNGDIPPSGYAFSISGANTPDWVRSAIYLGQKIDVT